MFFMKKENPKTILEGLDRAQEMLDQRLEAKLITPEMYQKQSMEFRKKREKYEKKLGISKYDKYN